MKHESGRQFLVGKESAAHVVIPLLNDDEFSSNTKRLGTRHRAAASISQETDAIAVVVSEETGLISIAKKGRLIRGLKPEELRFQLRTILLDRKAPWKRLGNAGDLGMAGLDEDTGDGEKDGDL